MPNDRPSTSPFSRNQKSEFASILTGVVAFVGVIIPAFFDQKIEWPVTLLLLSVLVYLLGNRVADFFLKTENNLALDDIIKAVRDPVDRLIDCTYVGTYEEAIEYVRGKLKFAEYVKDTIIAYGISKTELDIYFYDYEGTRSVQAMFADMLKRGKVYRAVISSDESVKGMFGNMEAIPPDKRKLLHIKVLNKSYPSINFTILEYGPGDDNREVLFGWGHHIHDERGHVFGSKNPKLVDTFDKLFQSLSRDACDFDPFLPCKPAVDAPGKQQGGVELPGLPKAAEPHGVPAAAQSGSGS